MRLSDPTSAAADRRTAGGPVSNARLGSLVEVHRADRPATNPDARYNRALQRLSSGDVDQALAETMRLPGASRAGDWVDKARRYIAAHRALDEIESAALCLARTSRLAASFGRFSCAASAKLVAIARISCEEG